MSISNRDITSRGTTALSYCVLKYIYYGSHDISKIIDNKIFWKTISLLILNKRYSTNFKIALLKNEKILSEESKVGDTFNKFFSSVVRELKIEKDDNLLTDVREETDQVLKPIKKYKNYASVFQMKSFFKVQKHFGLNTFMLRT